MKKLLIVVIILLCSIKNVYASEKIEVKFSKCVDGDTAYFILNNEEIKTRFLAIDTPESTTSIEPYGKEASEFTCNQIKNARKIEIEYDDNSDIKDKYNRDLVWVFVDDYLLQDLLIKNGLAEVAYLYGNYKYTDTLKDHQEIAKANKINIWNDLKKSNVDYIYLASILVIIIVSYFSKKIIRKFKRKLKRK